MRILHTQQESASMERRLKDDKILETVEKLEKRVEERFPGSGLSGVAGQLVELTRDSFERANSIRRPDYAVRLGLVLVVLLAIGGIAWHFYTSPSLKVGVQ